MTQYIFIHSAKIIQLQLSQFLKYNSKLAIKKEIKGFLILTSISSCQTRKKLNKKTSPSSSSQAITNWKTQASIRSLLPRRPQKVITKIRRRRRQLRLVPPQARREFRQRQRKRPRQRRPVGGAEFPMRRRGRRRPAGGNGRSRRLFVGGIEPLYVEIGQVAELPLAREARGAGSAIGRWNGGFGRGRGREGIGWSLLPEMHWDKNMVLILWCGVFSGLGFRRTWRDDCNKP